MIKIVSLNIEVDLHKDAVLSFLASESHDVACIQEVFESDVALIAKEIGYAAHHYLPMTRRHHELDPSSPKEEMGVAIFSKLPFLSSSDAYYWKPQNEIVEMIQKPLSSKRSTVAHGIAYASIEKDGAEYNIATTHFTWTPDSRPDDYQRTDAKALIALMKTLKPAILCGDFNVPRKETNDVYKTLASTFTDTIPLEVIGTLDMKYHKGARPADTPPQEVERLSHLVVDYIFSTPEYIVSNVTLKEGLSDHQAVIAEIEKAAS